MGILKSDSRLMQSFRLLFDYLAANLVFVACCIPVITIGSAHVALYTAIRCLQRGQPWLRTFWETFKTSLKRPTIVWVVCLPIIYLFTGLLFTITSLGLEGSTPAIVCAGIVLGVVACVASMAFLLYSRFEMTAKELFRNSLVMIIANPIQAVLGAALLWAPVAIFVLVPWLFLEIAFWLLIIYFSVASALFARLMRYPIGRLADEIPEKPEPYLIREAKKLAGRKK